jgi:hypothetical protein
VHLDLEGERGVVTIRLVAEWTTDFGGEEHTGWLPKEATEPEPTPVSRVELALAILEDGPESYILEWRGPTQETSGDRWYPSVEAALAEADEFFGIPRDAWGTPEAVASD